jgi:hypothetical protein
MTDKSMFKVISGNATPEEIAIILAVVSKSSSVKVLPEPTKLSTWGDPRSHMRHHLAVGPSAWRQSSWANH